MAKKVKPVKKVVKRRAAPKSTAMPDDLKAALITSLNRVPPPQHQEIVDARGGVLAELAEVLKIQSRAVETIAQAAVQAPNYTDSVKIG